MTIDIYHINAFTYKENIGNPACVIKLKNWLPDSTMLKIAKDNGVAETSFFIKDENSFSLRWFTPEIEMDLCGHATLATAHCIISQTNYENETILFKTKSGLLDVKFSNKMYHMNLPKREGKSAILPKAIYDAVNIKPLEIFKARDYMLVYKSEEDIKAIKINQPIFDQINIAPGGVIVTAPGKSSDFVSRFFTPQASILEDPVTGSSHCTLTPYWANRLGKNELEALQLSKRGGKLFCINKADKVQVSGQAVTSKKSILEIKKSHHF